VGLVAGSAEARADFRGVLLRELQELRVPVSVVARELAPRMTAQAQAFTALGKQKARHRRLVNPVAGEAFHCGRLAFLLPGALPVQGMVRLDPVVPDVMVADGAELRSVYQGDQG
jgi:hypothetical protein